MFENNTFDACWQGADGEGIGFVAGDVDADIALRSGAAHQNLALRFFCFG